MNLFHQMCRRFGHSATIKLSETLKIGNSQSVCDSVKSELDDCDKPIQLSHNPYEKPRRKCILCRNEITLDYKNARLLQQFVSNFSGRVYDR